MPPNIKTYFNFYYLLDIKYWIFFLVEYYILHRHIYTTDTHILTYSLYFTLHLIKTNKFRNYPKAGKKLFYVFLQLLRFLTVRQNISFETNI